MANQRPWRARVALPPPAVSRVSAILLAARYGTVDHVCEPSCYRRECKLDPMTSADLSFRLTRNLAPAIRFGLMVNRCSTFRGQHHARDTVGATTNWARPSSLSRPCSHHSAGSSSHPVSWTPLERSAPRPETATAPQEGKLRESTKIFAAALGIDGDGSSCCYSRINCEAVVKRAPRQSSCPALCAGYCLAAGAIGETNRLDCSPYRRRADLTASQ